MPEPSDNLTIVAVAVTALITACVVALLVWAVVRASRQGPAAMVTVSIALLALVAILMYAITGIEGLDTIAGTAVGALAGAVTALFSRKHPGDGDEGE